MTFVLGLIDPQYAPGKYIKLDNSIFDNTWYSTIYGMDP